MVVQHNLTAMNSNRMLGITQGQQAKASEKLSSGYRINRAGDDAAGLSISEKMRKQINGLDRASTNAQDGISAVQTAEGALTEVHSMLQRMNELAVQAANGTNSTTDRQAIQDEIDQLVDEIDRVATTTKFNETYLLNGKGVAEQKGTATDAQTLTLHVGADQYMSNTISVKLSAMSANGIGVDVLKTTGKLVGGADAATDANAARTAISTITAAIQKVSTQRSALGAVQNRLEHTIANLDNVVENTTAAESRIRDTDMAEEMVEYSKNNILAQAGQSMLAQANAANQGVLSLLG